MELANTVAMRLANVSATTKNIAGGEIVRDAKGNPTGVFKDNAMNYIYKVVADPPAELKDRALETAMKFVAAKGVTSVQNMGTWDELATFRRAHDRGTLTTRIAASVPLSTWARLRDEISKNGHGDKWLRIGGLKGFVDGSLGSHTAAMLAPFSDKPTDKGFFVTPLDSLLDFTMNADRNGLQVMVHAIGDRAIREQLNIFEKVEKQNGNRDRRFRIEHAQHIDRQDIARFGKLKIIPSMQPYHCIDDGRWAEKVIGMADIDIRLKSPEAKEAMISRLIFTSIRVNGCSPLLLNFGSKPFNPGTNRSSLSNSSISGLAPATKKLIPSTLNKIVPRRRHSRHFENNRSRSGSNSCKWAKQ